MINFFWIVLISIIISIIASAITISGLYLFWDSIHAFIIKRKIPKDKSKFLDAGRQEPDSDKEVQQDGEYRDYERLREEGFRSLDPGERAIKDEDNIPRQFIDEPGNAEIDADAGKFNNGSTESDEKW